MINETISRILDLQKKFTAVVTPAMTERNDLLKNDLRRALDVLVMSTPGLSKMQVEASGGLGNNAVVPWARIFDPSTSPSAQSGWYIVFLFSGDGSAVYLSLDLGVTKLSAKQIDEIKALALAGIQSHVFSSQSSATDPLEEIDLGAPGNNLARLYEKGNLIGFRYEAGSIPSDSEILEDIKFLYERLELVQSLDLNVETPEVLEKIAPELSSPEPKDEIEELIEAIHWPKERIAELLGSLFDASPQIVLTGPPGTGKTFVAKAIAKYILSDGSSAIDIMSRIKIVQFHPSYGYEEFVEGLRPVSGANGNIEFKAVEGSLIQLTDQIEIDGKPRVLIIDEMNRANLPRVFGELMYLLEYRAENISLMLRNSYRLPANLFIIGTMNTADKSIKNVDAAMRRRFDFFTVDPDPEILRSYYLSAGENVIGETLYEGFEQLNKAIEYDMGESGYAIGHSYFMHEKLDADELTRIWSRQIYPLLGDYFADRMDVLRDYSISRFWKID